MNKLFYKLKMNEFTNSEQINYYQMTRPNYTKEQHDLIIKNTQKFNNYLDIACGCGQVNKYN